jgi:hypothetical protein
MEVFYLQLIILYQFKDEEVYRLALHYAKTMDEMVNILVDVVLPSKNGDKNKIIMLEMEDEIKELKTQLRELKNNKKK